jgi:hypothetical protein
MAVEKIRKTGKDYRKEWNKIEQSQKSLKAHVQQRLTDLVRKYPEMSLPDVVRNEWFDSMSAYGMIGYIEKIEEWSEERQGVRQLKME